jgi:hypothetical protein
MTSKNVQNFLAVSQAFVDVISSGPNFDRWYSDEQMLTILSASYDMSTYILPDSDVTKSLTIFNKAIYKSPLLSGIDSKNGSEGGLYRMKFSIVNEDRERKNRYFYSIASNKTCPPMPLSPVGAQVAYDRKLRKSTRKRPHCESIDPLINDDADDFVTSNTNDTTSTQTITACNNDYTTNNH